MEKRTPIIAGNWKMYKTLKEAQELVNSLKRELYKASDVDIIICPPFTLLIYLADMLESSNIKLGAQDLFWEDEGAYTGEVSAKMLKDAGCDYCIIGHSERRQYFNETNETVNKKLFAALKNGLTPIVCIGENLKEREAGKTIEVIKNHLTGGLAGLKDEEAESIIIAYEPVWAIGTGKVATPEQAQEVHKYIREWLAGNFNPATAQKIRIQYGGSVKPENIKGLMEKEDIDGALVGGASLKLESFKSIVLNSKS